MATYTDLHNKIKETITVDYKDRVTTQEVKFKNGKNEYWGTLKGGVVAEDIDVKKGTLEGVIIKNSKVEGSLDLPGGVNLAKVGTDIALLSDDLAETKEWLRGEEKERIAYDIKESQIRASMDTALSIAIDNAITATNAADKLLKEQFEAADKQIRDDFTLSCNDLTDKILSVRSDLGYETFIRSKQDEQLSNLISNVEKESIIRDTNLNNSLHEHTEQAKKELAETKSTLLSAIEKDRHYVINFENTHAYPFNSKDFAVNVYNTKVVDGVVVYTDVMEKQHNIGSIIKEKNGTITFKSFAEYTTKDLTEALPINTTLNFEGLPNTKLLEGSNYRFHIEADNPEDLSTIRIQLEPLRTQYRQLLCEGEPVGKVLSANPDDVTLPLESGVLYFDASNNELDVFNRFKNIEFNNTNLSVLTKVDENPTERITYLGDNKFKFEKNIRKYDYISLFDDTLENSKKHFGKIYKHRGISGVIYNEEGEVEQINVTLDNNVYCLDAKNNFTTNVVETDDYIDQLSASVNGTEAKISYTKISEKYSYDFSGFNESGDVITSGKVIPVQYNKTLNESRNFETVSVDLTNVMRIEAFRKNYLLHRINKDEEKWSTSVTDDNGKNTLDIIFNVVNVLIKVTSKTTGEILRLVFNVKNNEPVVANSEEAYINIGTDNLVDLTNFNNSVEEAKEYEVHIEPHTTNSNETLIANINVNTSTSGILKIKIPTRKVEEISHEFMVVIKPTCYTDKKLVELEFVDDFGHPVKILNNRHEKLLVPTNKWSTIQLNEINYGTFFVKDMDEGEHEFEYNKLRKDVNIISVDVNNHKLSADQKFAEIDANIEYLSDEISTKWEATCLSANNLCIALSNEIEVTNTEIKYLSNEISSNDRDIAEIFNRIKGGINYKGAVVAEIESTDSTGQQIKKITSISALFFREGTTPESLYKNADEILSSGYMYIVTTLSPDANKKFNIEGKDIEVGDQIIINCKDVNGKAIKDLTINDVDIIDNEDYDTVHRPEFINLSNSLSTEIDNLSNSLSTTTRLSVENLQNQIISNDTDIKYLSNEISSNDTDIKYLSDEISSNDVDIASISSMMKVHELSGIVYFGNFIEYTQNTLTVFLHNNIQRILTIETPKDYQFRSGYQYRFNISTELDGTYFGANDYIIFNKDVKLKDVKLQDFDIIRNAQSEVEHLSNELQKQIISNDNDIKYLSDEISSNDADIKYLSDEISTKWEATCLSVNNLCVALSDEISRAVAYEKYLSDEISLNDADIKYLSDEISSNDADIEVLNDKVEFLLSVGHDSVEYKGTIPFDSEKIDFNLSAFIRPLVNDKNGFIKRGFLYRLSATEDMLSDYTGYKTYLGEKDFFIVNEDTTLDTITFRHLDIFRNAETEVEHLSNELQKQISSNDADIKYLSDEISLSANNLCIALSDEIDRAVAYEKYLSDEISLSANNLCIALSDEIDRAVAYEKYLSDEISSNDVDIASISSMMKVHELSGIVYFGNFIDYKETSLTVFLHDNIKQIFNVEIPGDYQFRSGYQYRFNISTELNGTYFGANDYIIFNKDVKLKDVTLSDFDIIRNAQSEVEHLSNELQKQIISNDNDIKYLSDEISTKWEATCLSVNNLCVALSDEISRAVLKENNLCLEISSLSNQVSSISSYLSDEISLNDADIKYLSDEISGNMLCTELSVSNLDGRINELSTHHIDHYDKTFVETTSENGPDKIFDSLKITDCDNTNNKYKLIFKDGTLVLEKLS